MEGQIAGLAAAGKALEARRFFRERNKSQRFAIRLERAFQLREELKNLPDSETVICRCEDVRYGRLQGHHSWRAAKLHTRCGMGRLGRFAARLRSFCSAGIRSRCGLRFSRTGGEPGDYLIRISMIPAISTPTFVVR